MNINFCKTCGAPLVQKDAYTWECGYCHNVYSDECVAKESERLLKALLDEQKAEKVANLRRNLYDAINATYTDSNEICRICGEIKALLPDDFMASFYYIANHDTPKALCEAIRSIDAEESINYVEGIVAHIAKAMRSEYALPLQNLVERAFKNTDMQKFEELSTLISDEVEKVNAGMYETAVPRSAFIAYSSRDMEKVEELVHYLESNGLDCFVAARNLRHGRGAVQNYEVALHEAIDNCGCVVLVSSKNSRNMECDALKVELKYIKNSDILGAPAEFRKNYTSIPYLYKKDRVEYRIDNEKTQPYAEKVVSEFFSGLEYACSPEEVVDRIYNFDTAGEESAPVAVEVPDEAVKYCSSCGSENKENAKFCLSCGNNEFFSTYKEYELAKELAAARAKEPAVKTTDTPKEEKSAKKSKSKSEPKKAKASAERASSKKKADNPPFPWIPGSGIGYSTHNNPISLRYACTNLREYMLMETSPSYKIFHPILAHRIKQKEKIADEWTMASSGRFVYDEYRMVGGQHLPEAQKYKKYTDEYLRKLEAKFWK